MKERTFPLNSIIKQDEMNSSLWRSEMANIFYGRCHTFRNTEKILTGVPGGRFFLDPKIAYKVFIHDPQFYHVLPNTLAFPRILLNYKADQKPGYFNYYYITVTQHHLLNRPEQPCEEEEKEDYDFLKCVKTSQAKSVGCRPPWDIWSPESIPLCQTVEELQEYELLDKEAVHFHQAMIVNRSGCKIPCNYKVGVTLTHLI